MTLRLAVLGDSIAFGQGASSREDRPASRLARMLTARGVDVTTRVLAVPGARSAQLGSQVAAATDWLPQVAVIVIGANDLTHQTPPEGAARDLGAAVRRLREAGASVVVAPAPDLSIVPHVPEALRPVVAERSATLRSLQVAAVRDAGGRVADEDGSTSAAFAGDRGLFCADAFHPSSAGYAVITGALWPGVLAAVDELLAHG